VDVVVFFAGAFAVPEVLDCAELDCAGLDVAPAELSCAEDEPMRSIPVAMHGNKVVLSSLCIGFHCPILRERWANIRSPDSHGLNDDLLLPTVYQSRISHWRLGKSLMANLHRAPCQKTTRHPFCKVMTISNPNQTQHTSDCSDLTR